MATAVRSVDRILVKALELFSTRGYEATSVREICEASGITKPTLYHFYRSKEGVYRAIVDGTLEDFRGRVRAALATGGSVTERLRGVAHAYFSAALEHPDRARFVFALIHNPPDSAPPTDFPHFYDGILQLVASAVEEGAARGEIAAGPTQVRLLVFMGALAECVCGFLIAGRPELTEELADALVDTVLGGWGPPQGERQR